jgi:hypothetical protein
VLVDSCGSISATVDKGGTQQAAMLRPDKAHVLGGEPVSISPEHAQQRPSATGCGEA